MKVLVVDDDPKRLELICKILIDKCSIHSGLITKAGNTNTAKNLMRLKYYDILILDVILPALDETPNARNGIRLLQEISTRTRLNKPNKIVGITASSKDIHAFVPEFEKFCFKIIEASDRNKDWISHIINAVNYDRSSSIDKNNINSDYLCITIHGIESTGGWQETLQESFKAHTNKIVFQNYDYGVFTLFSFMIPFLRLKVVSKFAKDFQATLVENKDKKIIIIAHSFGTYIAVRAIEKLIKNKFELEIETIILCGSVLKKTQQFSTIIENTGARVINECGIGDKILLLSEFFVPNTGMAGRVGFLGLNTDSFRNRFHSGGHSLYFEKSNNFCEKYWLTLLSDNDDICRVDERKNNLLRSYLVEKPMSFVSKFKEVIYLSGLAFLLYKLF
jgi:CheY-like chemotaxis protein